MFFKTLFPKCSTYSSAIYKYSHLYLNQGKLTNLIVAAPHVESVRYAARKGTRAAANAEKKARKLQQAAKTENVIPKYLQRKVKVSAELERTRCTDENWLESKPIDNVYNMKLYRGKPYSFAEAIAMHRECHMPEMLNDASAFVYANIELDLKLKKKTRFLEGLNSIVRYANEFETLRKNRVIVICKTMEDQVKATEAGAVYAGSNTLIKQILSGAVAKEDFDYIICHPDMYKECSALRGILAKKYPNAHNGLLRIDIEPAVFSFINGIEYNLKRSNIEPDFGWLDVCIGRLNMPVNALEENLKHILDTVEKQKPSGTDHILFVIRTLIFCDKSRERFKIPHWQYLPNYPENGVLVGISNDIEKEIENKETSSA